MYQGNHGYQHGKNVNYGQGVRQDTKSSTSSNQNPPQQNKTLKLEDTLNQFIEMIIVNQKKKNKASTKNLETQVGKISKQLADQQGIKFIANTQTNQREQCKAIITWSGIVIKIGVDENQQ